MALMGIDGGGSTLRVVITDETLTPLAEARASTANPGVIGRDDAADRIRRSMREAMRRADVTIDAVAIGIAGASPAHSAGWLLETVQAVLPGAQIVLAPDTLIALAGAHGRRHGAIVLAGTGSVALAVNPQGEMAQTGGWGYLLGDEGGGYWLGMEGLRACVRWHDGIEPEADPLARQVLSVLHLTEPVELIAWLYRQPPPTREVAALAALVLDGAAQGDPVALAITERGAAALAIITRAAMARVDAEPDIRFCGSLLTANNPLSAALCRHLGIIDVPLPLHPPVIGAVLMAKWALEA
jgi:N-acetylglucosamine kinase-like BadF-type ATPase